MKNHRIPAATRPVLHRKLLAVLASFGMVLTTLWVWTPSAWAGHKVKLKVVIERITQTGCTDNLSGSDFYARITIAGENFDHGPTDGFDDLIPQPVDSWKGEKVLEVDTQSPAAVSITVAESDGGLNFGDDACDITPNEGTTLDLTVPLIPCSVTGDATGACATSIKVGGVGDEGDGNADVTFRVEVNPSEPEVAGLAVRCTHTPLWPQPGDDVTITVESLNGSVQVGDTVEDRSNDPDGTLGVTLPALVDRRKIADHLEIWVSPAPGPIPDRPDLDAANKSVSSFTIHDVAAGDLEYGCVVRKGADTEFPGWRKTRVGAPAQGVAVPVIMTGGRANSIDVVLIADRDDFTSSSDAAFLTAANNVIKGAYYGQDYFLEQQQHINFWLADQRGDAEGVQSSGSCLNTVPSNWATEYAAWTDTGAILHTNAFRDCAQSKVFSAEHVSLGTVLHETGHAPFNLADEYGGPNFGGYWELLTDPNLYDTLAECEADAPALLRTYPNPCRSFTDTRPTPDKTWYTSEPEPNDLMNRDRRPPQAADLRRMNTAFQSCAAGSC
jgi:hypothetical protein